LIGETALPGNLIIGLLIFAAASILLEAGHDGPGI